MQHSLAEMRGRLVWKALWSVTLHPNGSLGFHANLVWSLPSQNVNKKSLCKWDRFYISARIWMFVYSYDSQGGYVCVFVYEAVGKTYGMNMQIVLAYFCVWWQVLIIFLDIMCVKERGNSAKIDSIHNVYYTVYWF